jgi:hypothetical protein
MDIVRASKLPLTADQIRLVAAATNELPDAVATKELIQSFFFTVRGSSTTGRPDVRVVMDKRQLWPNIVSFGSDFWHDVLLLKNGTVLSLHYALLPQYINGRQGMGLPAGLTDVVAVGAWRGWSYALKRDGSLVKWNSQEIDRKNEIEARSCAPNC